MRRFVLVLGLLLFAGLACTHSHQFNQNPEIGTLGAHNLSGKRIALDLSATPESHDDNAGGHSFSITGIRGQAEIVVRKAFANDQLVASPQQADVVLALAQKYRMSTSGLGAGCKVDSTWTITDPAGAVLATGAASDESSMPAMDNGGRNCEIASLRSLGAALDMAMASLTPGAVVTGAARPAAQPAQSAANTGGKYCPVCDAVSAGCLEGVEDALSQGSVVKGSETERKAIESCWTGYGLCLVEYCP